MPKLKKEHLINWFKEGEKKREDWKIGTEHEKFVFHLNNLESFFFLCIQIYLTVNQSLLMI